MKLLVEPARKLHYIVYKSENNFLTKSWSNNKFLSSSQLLSGDIVMLAGWLVSGLLCVG